MFLVKTLHNNTEVAAVNMILKDYQTSDRQTDRQTDGRTDIIVSLQLKAMR